MGIDSKQSYQWRKQLMWGLVLVAFGIGLLLDQMGKLDILSLWHYLPLLMVVVGVNRMIGYPTADEFITGLWWLIIGVWLFGNLEHVFGMRFQGSWPYLIIAWGVSLILKPFMRQRLALNERNRTAPPVPPQA